MTDLDHNSWWQGRRRLLSITAFIAVGLFILARFTSRSIVHVKGDSHSHHRRNWHFHVYGALHYLGEVPWKYIGLSSDEDFFTNSTMNDVKFSGTKKLPQALIIGAKKAGTRALLEFIRVHPNVRAAGHEVHYFDRNYLKGRKWYREMMPTSIEGQITIEKTPSYLVTVKAPERVHNLNPSMKIIIVLKDPVDRAISDFTQSSTKHRRQRSFEDSVFKDFYNLVVNDTKSSISTGVYSEHLIRWMEYFPFRQFCFINGETLVTNPATELKKLQDFLQLQQIITEDHFYFNSTKGFPCLKKREASGVPHCLGNGKGRPHPKISVEAKVALHEYFKPFNVRLYKMIGINFDWEGRSPTRNSLKG